MTERFQVRLASFVLAGALLLAGCGHSDNRANELERAAQSYNTAWLKMDAPSVYGSWSERCKRTDTESGVDDKLKVGPFFSNAVMKDIKVRVEGDRGYVTEHFDQSILDETDQPWLYENGSWTWDAC